MARTNQRSIPIALFIIAIALVAGRITLQAMKTTPAQQAGAVHWLTPEEGHRIAKTTGKPLLYDFTAEWCGPCHLLDEEVFENTDVAAAINQRFVPVRVTDRQREEGTNPPDVDALQERYSVRGFPTVVFADANGSERARLEGFRGREEFQRVMETAR